MNHLLENIEISWTEITGEICGISVFYWFRYDVIFREVHDGLGKFRIPKHAADPGSPQSARKCTCAIFTNHCKIWIDFFFHKILMLQKVRFLFNVFWIQFILDFANMQHYVDDEKLIMKESFLGFFYVNIS